MLSALLAPIVLISLFALVIFLNWLERKSPLAYLITRIGGTVVLVVVAIVIGNHPRPTAKIINYDELQMRCRYAGMPRPFSTLPHGFYTVTDVLDKYGLVVILEHLPTADVAMMVTETPDNHRHPGATFTVN